MTFVKRMAAVTLGGAMVTGASLSFSPAQAGYTVTLTQQGSNVVATGSGTIDLAALSLLSSGVGLSGADIHPSIGEIFTGPLSKLDAYTGFTGPASFGSGGFNVATGSESGTIVGINDSFGQLDVASGYMSGTSVSNTATYDNTTLSVLGVTPGTYVWSWGSGATADSFTLIIGGSTTVPEPSAIVLLGTALAGLALVGFRHAGATAPAI